MKLILLLTAVLLVSGCGSRQETKEHGTAVGQFNGTPLQVEWKRDSEGTTTVLVPPLVTAAAGLLPSPWGDIATAVLALTTGGAAIAARSQKQRADEHKADADEGWQHAIDAKKV